MADPLQIDLETKLPGTVGYYKKHMVICTGREEWEPRIQDEGGLLKELTDAFIDRKDIKITACDLPSQGEGLTLFLFPENVRIRGITSHNIDQLKQYILFQETNGLCVEGNDYDLVLVCTHEKRDVRCGFYGKRLLEAIKKDINELGMSKKVVAAGSSHLGGHKYAGVAVIYPSANWYGRLSEREIPGLLEAEFVYRRPFEQVWRGGINQTPEEQIQYAVDQGWMILDDNFGSV